MGIPVFLLARELNLGGIERDVSKFSRNLGRFGFEPHVGCFNPGGMRWKEIEAAGVPAVEVPLRSFRNASLVDSARVFRDYTRRHRIELIHAFDVPASMFAIPLARLWGIPALSSQLCYRELSSPGTRAVLTVIDRLATGVFVNCEAIREHLVNDWRVSRDRIYRCYNALETEEFHSRGRHRPPNLADASVVIGAVAVLREEKRLDMLLHGFAEVARGDRKARLVIVGDGAMKESLQSLAASLGIAEVCSFEPATRQPAEWLRAIDVFALPSRSEAFSNALLEAMGCGCCPVASDVGGTPELVADGERGLLFQRGNQAEFTQKLVLLARDRALCERMGQAAARFVHENFAVETITAGLAALYQSVLVRSGRAPKPAVRS